MLESCRHSKLFPIHAPFISNMTVTTTHQVLKTVLSKDYQSSAHMATVHTILYRNGAQSIADNWRLQKSVNDRMSSPAKVNMRKKVLGNNRDKVLGPQQQSRKCYQALSSKLMSFSILNPWIFCLRATLGLAVASLLQDSRLELAKPY